MHTHLDLSFYAAAIRGKRTHKMNETLNHSNDNVAYCLSFAPRRIIILPTCHMQVSFLQPEKAAAATYDGK